MPDFVGAAPRELRRYLVDELTPAFERMGFTTALWDSPVAGGPPFLFAERIEDPALTTVLMYGHGDVVLGYDGHWKQASSPWVL
ncbi:MAG TPA: M20 peptidase family dipeptidase, partial [Casimicrobiaceae bacterium]